MCTGERYSKYDRNYAERVFTVCLIQIICPHIYNESVVQKVILLKEYNDRHGSSKLRQSEKKKIQRTNEIETEKKQDGLGDIKENNYGRRVCVLQKHQNS